MNSTFELDEQDTIYNNNSPTTLSDLKKSYKYLIDVKKYRPNDYEFIKKDIIQNNSVNINEIKSKYDQYTFNNNIYEEAIPNPSHINKYPINSSNSNAKLKNQFSSNNLRNNYQSHYLSKLSQSIEKKQMVYKRSDGEYFYPDEKRKIDETSRFYNSNKPIIDNKKVLSHFQKPKVDFKRYITPQLSGAYSKYSATVNDNNSSQITLQKQNSQDQSFQYFNKDQSLTSLNKFGNSSERSVRGFKLNSKAVLESSNFTTNNENNSFNYRSNIQDSIDDFLHTSCIPTNHHISNQYINYNNKSNTSGNSRSPDHYWKVNLENYKYLSDGKNIFRMNETIKQSNPPNIDGEEDDVNLKELDENSPKKIIYNPKDELSNYKSKIDKFKVNDDYIPEIKKRLKKKSKKILNPLDLIRKRIENNVNYNRMIKKIDPSILYNQESDNTPTTMDKKLKDKSNHTIYFEENMCLFYFDKTVLFNYPIWRENLPIRGMHKYENAISSAVSQFVKSSNFIYNIQVMFKEYHKILTSTQLSQIVAPGVIPAQHSDLKLEDIRWVLLEQKVLSILKLYFIEYFSLLSFIFKIILKTNINYIKQDNSFSMRLSDEREDMVKESLELDKLQKKSNKIVDVGLDSIVTLNDYIINKFLIDRFYIVELKKFMYTEALAKKTQISSAQFQKMVTFEDYVHDYDTVVKVENTHYNVNFYFVEQLYKGLKALNYMNEINTPTGVYNVVRLIK